MIRLLAHHIARNRDELLPIQWAGREHGIGPLECCGVAVFKEYALELFRCTDCPSCEAGPSVELVDKADKSGKRLHWRCREEYGVEGYADTTEAAVFHIDPIAICRIIGNAFGCASEPEPVPGVYGAWCMGRSSLAFGNNRRTILFVRRFDSDIENGLSKNPSLVNGSIIIAASAQTPATTKAHIFDFAEMFTYDDTGLHVDPAPVSLRIAARAETVRKEKKAARKPNKVKVERLLKLANYLKDEASGLMSLCRSHQESAQEKTAATMKKYSMATLSRFFESDDAPFYLGHSTRAEYLTDPRFNGDLTTEMTRFWWRTCTDMETLKAVSDAIVRCYPKQINKIHKIKADKIYHSIIRHLPKEVR